MALPLMAAAGIASGGAGLLGMGQGYKQFRSGQRESRRNIGWLKRMIEQLSERHRMEDIENVEENWQFGDRGLGKERGRQLDTQQDYEQGQAHEQLRKEKKGRRQAKNQFLLQMLQKGAGSAAGILGGLSQLEGAAPDLDRLGIEATLGGSTTGGGMDPMLTQYLPFLLRR